MNLETPIAEGLFTWPSIEPELLGSRCDSCSAHAFPAISQCPQCGSRKMQVVGLGNEGTLWSWTIQGFLPKAPYNTGETSENFTPYGVGYVTLKSGVRVESRLRPADANKLTIGMSMQLVIEPIRVDEVRGKVMSFVFVPKAESEKVA